MIAAVEELVPELLSLVLSAYGLPSSLMWGTMSFSRQRECSREIPWVPCCSASPSTTWCKLNLFYLDDDTLGGTLEEVLHDFWTVEQRAGEVGLHFYFEKTEVICDESSIQEACYSTSLVFV